MDLRRLLLILAVLLLIAAGAASLAPPPQEESDTAPGSPQTTGTGEAKPVEPPSAEPVEAELEAAREEKDRPDEVRVDTGARVILTVSVPSAGQVELDGLGRVSSAEPGTPAVFDLLAERPGTYEAVFTPTEGPPRTAGALVVGGKEGSGGDKRASRAGLG